MERYMWSFDGKKYSEAGALSFVAASACA